MIVSLGVHPEMNRDLDNLQKVYEKLGVEVIRVNLGSDPDSVFHRDIFAWTPFGLIEGRMAKKNRLWEPGGWQTEVGRDFDITLSQGTFEGADLLWLKDRFSCFIGLGDRTDRKAARELRSLLANKGVSARCISLPLDHDQHLLGLANTIDDQLFFDEYFDEPLSRYLRSHALPFCERHLKHANWVQVGENVILNEACKRTIKIVSQFANPIPVPINQLLAHGGGVACATGIIEP